MKVETGYLYHIKDEFFEIVDDESLMSNHERGKQRPTYFTIKDKDILWFIPLSSKTEKYEKIVERKIKKYGKCSSILIREIAGKKSAILIQNAFPTLEKYIDHMHMIDGKPIKVTEIIKEEILESFKDLMYMKDNGNDLFFTNIDALKIKMLDEIKEKTFTTQ